MTKTGALLFIAVGIILFIWGVIRVRHTRKTISTGKEKSKYEAYAEHKAALAHGSDRGYEFGMKWRRRFLGLFKGKS